MELKEWLLAVADGFEDTLKRCNGIDEVITISNELAVEIANRARTYAEQLGSD